MENEGVNFRPGCIYGRSRWGSKNKANGISLRNTAAAAKYVHERVALILWESSAINICPVGAGIDEYYFARRNSTIYKNAAMVLQNTTMSRAY